MRKFLVCIVAAIFAMPGTLKADNERIDLSDAQTLADSVEVLYSMLDVSDRQQEAVLAREMLDLAVKSGDSRTGLNMICHLADLNIDNDSTLKSLKDECMMFPDSEKRQLTMIYLSLRRAGNAARYTEPSERLERVKKAISDGYFDTKKNHPYAEFERDASVCILLTHSAYNGLLSEYLERTLQELEELPEDAYEIRNLMYLYGTAIYTNMGQHDKAVEVNKKRIKLLEDHIKQRREEGRENFNYDYVFSIVYRVMLQNYEALTPEEIEYYHNRLKTLGAKNADVAQLLELGVADAFYSMAVKDYAAAIPKLKKLLTESDDRFIVKEAHRQLFKAADAVGDKELAYNTIVAYNKILEDYIDMDAQDSYTELRILYDVSKLHAENAELELERMTSQAAARTRIIVIVAVVFAILCIASLIVYRYYRKNHRLQSGLFESRKALEQESESLALARRDLVAERERADEAEQHQKRFVKNMTAEMMRPLSVMVECSKLIADCSDAQNKPYLTQYAEALRVNAEQLLDQVTDVFKVSELQNNDITVAHEPVNLNLICDNVIYETEPMVKEGVELKNLKADSPEVIITTDADRVERVLITLLDNAAKFTEQGSIELDYKIDTERNNVTFTVTDTGIGIPSGKEEVIFQQFTKLDRQTIGVGLGLSIARMIADLLHGEIKVDTSWEHGSRFIFTIPTL